MLIKPRDDYRKRLRLLQELQNSDRLDERQKTWLQNELRRLTPGLSGEKDAAHYLDLTFSSGENHAVLHDLRLEADGQVAQIDHLIVNRLLMFYMLETKTYNGSLQINEHGEFTVEYANERRYGIESPLEQSRRHETVLKKVLQQLGITGRAGTQPTFVHVVMVHPKAIIERPPADKFDSSMVIKADQFKTWHEKYVDKMSTGTFLAKTINFRGRDTVREWGELLKSAHCPINQLALPEFMKPKQAPTIAPVTKKPTTNSVEPCESSPVIAKQIEASKPICAECGKLLTPRVAQFCRDHAKRFSGKLYCYDHQLTKKKVS